VISVTSDSAAMPHPQYHVKGRKRSASPLTSNIGKTQPWGTSVPWGERCSLAQGLNNRLTVIIGECELLSDNLDDAHSVRLQAILKAAQEMADELTKHPCAAVNCAEMGKFRQPSLGELPG